MIIMFSAGDYYPPLNIPAQYRYPALKSKEEKQYFILPSGFEAKENRLVIPKFNEGIKCSNKYTIHENIKENSGVPFIFYILHYVPRYTNCIFTQSGSFGKIGVFTKKLRICSTQFSSSKKD